ncbi:glycosyltransferase family 4 protein [Luteolibacter ambystomatis]|uniref:Glycosyltransferase family 4 protein n=1 Tax=Luteolibacter ambystomatis TaxID=2824561 RepID=A0A975G8F3_9BACT|nr:glycosyltransferase family 4 protein [Luteolibacter ambystomatis]QUE50994.1 glycosyltransferase family 4 protein [Luteolibacter ambystomatis]
MKVVQLLPELDSGGVERGTLELARHLATHGHESIVISGGGRMVDTLEYEGSRHLAWPIGRKRLTTLRMVPKLRKWLEEEKPDILHLRSRVPAWVAWLAWRKMDPQTRPRLVTTVHGFNSVNRWSEIMTCGERVICVSDSIRQFVIDHYPRARPDKLRVIHRGVDPVDYPHGWQPPEDWRKKFETDFPDTRGKKLVTLPGRITRLKGHEDFLKILGSLNDPQIHGVIAGGAHPRKQAYLAEIQALADASGLHRQVTFTGNRSDLKNILAISDVVLSLTSQPESFGRTTLEALSLGVPVAGYDHGGVGEQLEELFPAGKIPPRDTAKASSVVRSFLDHRPQVPASHPFTLQRMLDQTVGVYQELLATPRP